MESLETYFYENLDELRLDVLRQLAEQAMTDPEFRAVARLDLRAALEQFGYDLNPHEMALALRFRDALADAGIDLFLEERFDPAANDLLSKFAS